MVSQVYGLFVRKALEDAGFNCLDVSMSTVFRMAAEIVLGIKPLQKKKLGLPINPPGP